MGSQLPEPPITDPEALKKYSGEHLYYELQMFFQAVAFRATRSIPRHEGSDFVTTKPPVLLTSSGEATWFVRMAAIEALVLHFRTLLTFLFPDESAVKPDDVAAHHFIAGPEPLQAWIRVRGAMSQDLRDAKTRADKELAHLTAKRIDGFAPGKEWPSRDMARELGTLFGLFVQCADHERLAPAVVEFVSQLRSG